MNAKWDNLFAHSTCAAPVYKPQEAVSLYCQSTLLAYVQLAVCQDLQVLFSKAALQPNSAQPVQLQGVLLLQVQDFAWVLAHFQKVLVHSYKLPGSPWMPLSILSGSPPALLIWCHLLQVTSKANEQSRASGRTLQNSACYLSPGIVLPINH